MWRCVNILICFICFFLKRQKLEVGRCCMSNTSACRDNGFFYFNYNMVLFLDKSCRRWERVLIYLQNTRRRNWHPATSRNTGFKGKLLLSAVFDDLLKNTLMCISFMPSFIAFYSKLLEFTAVNKSNLSKLWNLEVLRTKELRSSTIMAYMTNPKIIQIKLIPMLYRVTWNMSEILGYVNESKRLSKTCEF